MRSKATQAVGTALAKNEAKYEGFTDIATSYDRKSITTVKKRNMLDGLCNSMGIVSPAATISNTNKRTHYNWVHNDPAYKAAVDSITNSCLDFAESKLFQKIAAGDGYSIIFYLKTKGKHRGYVEKDDIRSATQNNIVVNVAIPTGI